MNVYQNLGSVTVMLPVQMARTKARNYAEWRRKSATKENSGLFAFHINNLFFLISRVYEPLHDDLFVIYIRIIRQVCQ